MLQMEVGKFYKAADGSKVECLKSNYQFDGVDYPILMYNNETGNPYSVTTDGHYYKNEEDNTRSIVSEWVDLADTFRYVSIVGLQSLREYSEPISAINLNLNKSNYSPHRVRVIESPE